MLKIIKIPDGKSTQEMLGSCSAARHQAKHKYLIALYAIQKQFPSITPLIFILLLLACMGGVRLASPCSAIDLTGMDGECSSDTHLNIFQ